MVLAGTVVAAGVTGKVTSAVQAPTQALKSSDTRLASFVPVDQLLLIISWWNISQNSSLYFN